MIDICYVSSLIDSVLENRFGCDARTDTAQFVNFLKRAQKFSLPENGVIYELKPGEAIVQKAIDFCGQINLPYPVTVIQYGMGGDSTVLFDDQKNPAASVLLCLQVDEKIHVQPAYRFREHRGKYGEWQQGVVLFDLCTKTGMTYPRLHPGANGMEKERICQEIQEDIAAVCGLICALSCKNIEIKETGERGKINKKRSRAMKTPFFTYHTLVLSGKRQDSKSNGGSSSSPRVHLRRGHIRRLTNKNIWVNACVVGDKSKGMVHKEYSVPPSAMVGAV